VTGHIDDLRKWLSEPRSESELAEHLCRSAGFGQREKVKLLLDHGACPNLPSGSWGQGQRPTTQRTALHEACIWKSDEAGEIVKLLLQFRANPRQVAKLKSKTMSAFEMACHKKNEVAKQAIEQFVAVTQPEGCLRKNCLLAREKAASSIAAIQSAADGHRDVIQLPGVDPEAVIIGAKLAPRYRKSMDHGLSMNEILDIASELSDELGKCRMKQEVVVPVLETVDADDLFFTQNSIKSSFGDETPLGDLVSWLDAAAGRDGSGRDFPFDLEKWRDRGTPQVIMRASGRRISNDNRRLWCIKEHQKSRHYPVKVKVLTFQLPQVFETYVRHRDASPESKRIRVRGDLYQTLHSDVLPRLLPEDSVSNLEHYPSAVDHRSTISVCSGNSVQGSLVSSATGQEDGEHCFLVGTRFERLDGSTTPAQLLQQFDYVRGFELELQVMSIVVLPESMQHDLVVIHAGSVVMTVTASHRVMVRRGDMVPARAGSLRVGDDVVCCSGVQRIVHVYQQRAWVSVVEIKFQPDSPVHTIPPDVDSILTKGSGRGRRSRQHQATSVTNTYDPFL
jgi:hypothetical protein